MLGLVLLLVLIPYCACNQINVNIPSLPSYDPSVRIQQILESGLVQNGVPYTQDAVVLQGSRQPWRAAPIPWHLFSSATLVKLWDALQKDHVQDFEENLPMSHRLDNKDWHVIWPLFFVAAIRRSKWHIATWLVTSRAPVHAARLLGECWHIGRQWSSAVNNLSACSAALLRARQEAEESERSEEKLRQMHEFLKTLADHIRFPTGQRMPTSLIEAAVVGALGDVVYLNDFWSSFKVRDFDDNVDAFVETMLRASAPLCRASTWQFLRSDPRTRVATELLIHRLIELRLFTFDMDWVHSYLRNASPWAFPYNSVNTDTLSRLLVDDSLWFFSCPAFYHWLNEQSFGVVKLALWEKSIKFAADVPVSVIMDAMDPLVWRLEMNSIQWNEYLMENRVSLLKSALYSLFSAWSHDRLLPFVRLGDNQIETRYPDTTDKKPRVLSWLLKDLLTKKMTEAETNEIHTVLMATRDVLLCQWPEWYLTEIAPLLNVEETSFVTEVRLLFNAMKPPFEESLLISSAISRRYHYPLLLWFVKQEQYESIIEIYLTSSPHMDAATFQLLDENLMKWPKLWKMLWHRYASTLLPFAIQHCQLSFAFRLKKGLEFMNLTSSNWSSAGHCCPHQLWSLYEKDPQLAHVLMDENIIKRAIETSHLSLLEFYRIRQVLSAEMIQETVDNLRSFRERLSSLECWCLIEWLWVHYLQQEQLERSLFEKLVWDHWSYLDPSRRTWSAWTRQSELILYLRTRAPKIVRKMVTGSAGFQDELRDGVAQVLREPMLYFETHMNETQIVTNSGIESSLLQLPYFQVRVLQSVYAYLLRHWPLTCVHVSPLPELDSIVVERLLDSWPIKNKAKILYAAQCSVLSSCQKTDSVPAIVNQTSLYSAELYTSLPVSVRGLALFFSCLFRYYIK